MNLRSVWTGMIVLLLLALPTPNAARAADDVSGRYRVRSMGKATDQSVQIEKLGDGYKVTWTYDGGGTDTGIGILVGDVFSVSWKKGGSHWVATYNVRPNGNLSGRYFSVEGGTTSSGQENWAKRR